MITPPLSIWARPGLTLKVPFAAGCPLPPFRCATVEILRGGYGESRVPALALVAGVELKPVPAPAPGAKPLPVKEPDGHLAGRRLARHLAIDRHLDPLDSRHRDPGRLVVVQPGGVVDLDQEVGLVEVEIAGRALQGLVVEEPDYHVGHFSPFLITVILPPPCGSAASRSCGCTSGRPPRASGPPPPAAAGACPPRMGPAAGPPHRDRARRPPRGPRIPP